MKILVVTSYNNTLYNEYAHRFRSTYNWPFELLVYNEDSDFYTKVPQLKKFVERNKNKVIGDKLKDFWKDGVRFCYKVYAYTDAIIKNSKNYDGIIGIDADSVFYNRIDAEWIRQHIHRDDCMMSYLGRGSHYSECGFLYWNCKHSHTFKFAQEMQDMYNKDLIYNERQQHDSFIWDIVRKRFEANYGIKNHNLGDGKTGHVQARSILGSVYDHTKGRRKVSGKSPEFERRR
jgi:hypothetical protein|tara:strand:+ start:178 stop:873 length:696 start_codon:yes stop_codon:yes gene_type:complete